AGIWGTGSASAITLSTCRVRGTGLARRPRLTLTRGQSAPSRASSSGESASSGARAESMTDSGRLAPGIGMTTGALASIQASVPRGGETRGGGNLAEGRVPRAQVRGPPDAAERAPRQERDARRGAVLQLALAGPERGGELVLHAGQVSLAQDRAGQLDLLDAGVRDAGQPDLPRVEQFPDGAGRLRVGHLRVGPVELVQAR